MRTYRVRDTMTFEVLATWTESEWWQTQYYVGPHKELYIPGHKEPFPVPWAVEVGHDEESWRIVARTDR